MEKPAYREPSDSPKHRLIEKYTRVTRLYQSMVGHQLEGTGIYRSQHRVLVYVPRNSGVSQKELAGVYGVSGATIVVSLKKPERGGCINRLVDQSDNRYNQTCITEKRKRVVKNSVPIFRRMELSMFEGFPGSNRKVPGELLDRTYENLQHIPDEREDN